MSLYHTQNRRYANWRRRYQRWFRVRSIPDTTPFSKLTDEQKAKTKGWIGNPNMRYTRRALSKGDYAFWQRHGRCWRYR